MTKLGFLGLGRMGSEMAKNLQKFLLNQSAAQSPQPDTVLRLYNRTQSKGDPLVQELGSVMVASPVDLASACDIIFLMLADDKAVEGVLTQMATLGCALEGKVIANFSTVQPSAVAGFHQTMAACGATYLSCPVFGRPYAASTANLVICMAGDSSGKALVHPFLSSMGSLVIDVSPEPHHANALKLIGNFMIVGLIELFSEAFLLADKASVDKSTVLAVIESVLPTAMKGYSTRCAATDFNSANGFTVDLGLKDVRYMRTLADESSCPLPLADLAFSHLLSARALGLGSQDWGALALALRAAAGLGAEQGAQGSVE